jgi:putative CocE/NonD family hydrolase
VSRKRACALLVSVLLLTGGLAAEAAPPPPTTHESGYITMRDGTRLSFTVDRPAGRGRFPVAMNYDGYCAGTGALACNDPELSAKLLASGYAVLGVNLRGTGCSSGTFDFRAREESLDGAAAVTWAASQPWSTGRVGLFGDSFPGLTQPGIAALRPKGLAAIAPFQVVDDVYRDVAYPGGIVNAEFGAFWGLADQPASEVTSPGAAAQAGDHECATNYAGNRAPGLQANIFLNAVQHPWDDSYWTAKEVGGAAGRITVPTFGCLSWQDDEVGSRPGWSLFRRIAPAKLWLVGTNGYHGMCDRGDHDRMNTQLLRFFDRYVRGVHNGWEKTPHVQIWHDANNRAGFNAPSWVTSYNAWPPATSTQRLSMTQGGVLTDQVRRVPTTGVSYQAPWPSAGMEEGVVLGHRNALWQRPVPAGGAAAWTTPRLARDVEVFGPASADLWLTSTGTDTDVQVTVTEVRPDGQETYVARGWLRASHRALNRTQSTATRPQQTHQQSSSQPLVPGVPALLRVEVFPFDHVFRAGSSIRLVVDTPSQTGGWNFGVLPTPVTNTVLMDAAHPSQLVLGVLASGRALRPLVPCGNLLNQPCRANAYPVPPGTLSWPRR